MSFNNGIITIEKLARFNDKIAEKYAQKDELQKLEERVEALEIDGALIGPISPEELTNILRQ